MKLDEFLVLVSTDPHALAGFISDADQAMRIAGLSEEEQSALRAGSAQSVYQRMAGGGATSVPPRSTSSPEQDGHAPAG
jgi:hypothetical protein